MTALVLVIALALTGVALVVRGVVTYPAYAAERRALREARRYDECAASNLAFAE